LRHMHLDRSVDNVERYKVAKKTAKQAVSEARGKQRVRCMMDYTSGWVPRKGRRTSIG
jgi:oxalate decarboxylase/phosphoglucose isomerase-like protein (cupin superfamily)